jgi:hypothetical protein
MTKEENVLFITQLRPTGATLECMEETIVQR